MAESKEQGLWLACTEGDLETARALANDPTIDVNWSGLEKEDTPLHRACRFGQLEIVKVLLARSEIEVNKGNKGSASPFFIACQEGRKEVVSLLLADPRVDPIKPNKREVSALFMACQEGRTEVVSLLLADPRIDPNKTDDEGFTPLWFTSQEGYLVSVQHLLASGREIDTKMISTHNNKTAAEQGRVVGTAAKGADQTEEDYERGKINGPLCADLIDGYERDPVAVRHRLHRQPGLREYFIGHLFALVVFHADFFAIINEKTAHSYTRRFFRITSQLPLDLQMVLCNRIFGSPRDIILSRDSEPGFRLLARTTTWQQ